MKIFAQISEMIEKVCNLIVTLVLMAMTVMYFSGIVQRYVVGQGFHGSEEITRYGMIWLVYTSAVVLTRLDEHLNVSILENMLKGTSHKIIKLVQRLIMMVYLCLMTGIGLQMVEIGKRQTSPNLSISMSIVYSIFPIAFVLMIIQFAFVILRDLTKKEEPETDSGA